MRLRVFAFILSVATVGAAHAIVLEDFETDMSNYSNGAGTNNNAVLQASSAHDGAMGAQFPGTGPWHYYDMGIGTSAGQIFRAYVRHNTGFSTGRMYMGVATSPTTGFSAVIGDNTSQILLQQHNPFGSFTTLQSVAFTVTRGIWYQLELDWAADGNMRASVWDEAGTTMLAATAYSSTGQTGTGGLAFRGFNSWEMDTVYNNVVPEPATMLIVGSGLAALISRGRRK